MSNFSFLKAEWPSLYREAFRAEQRAVTEPVSSLTYSRRALEAAVYEVYGMERLEMPYNTSLDSLLREPYFTRVLPGEYDSGVHIIRKYGNKGAHHGNRVTAEQATVSLTYLFAVLKWFAGRYSAEVPEMPPSFLESKIPTQAPTAAMRKQLEQAISMGLSLEAQMAALQRKNEELEVQMAASQEARIQATAETAQLRQRIEQRAAERSIPVGTNFTEAETRKHLIDAALFDAGWAPGGRLSGGYEAEHPITGMPRTTNPKGNGYVDYVLWDDNGLPLALIEAKRTSKDARTAGRHQAKLYADRLEAMYGRRPLIYLTNGYDIHFWDDAFYSATRRVYGFLTRDEMRTAVARRTLRRDLSGSTPQPRYRRPRLPAGSHSARRRGADERG